MRQRIGDKKRQRCEAVTGRTYAVAYQRGGWPVGWFQCWWADDPSNADFVNPKTGEWEPETRAGAPV